MKSLETLSGISIGSRDRYYLETFCGVDGICYSYQGVDRETAEDLPCLLQIWAIDVTEDAEWQDIFFANVQTLMQVEDRRLLKIQDGGILVIPLGESILKEVPFLVTEPIAGTPIHQFSEMRRPDRVLAVALQVTAALQGLHNGINIRSSSGQIIGQAKISHGRLSVENIYLQADSPSTESRSHEKVKLANWGMQSLFDQQYTPKQDVQDLGLLFVNLLGENPRIPKVLAKIFDRAAQAGYGNIKEMGQELRACQLAWQRAWWRVWGKQLVGLGLGLTGAAGLIIFWKSTSANKPIAPIGNLPPTPIGELIVTPPFNPVIKPLPSPVVIRTPKPAVLPSPQVYRIGFPPQGTPVAPPPIVKPPRPQPTPTFPPLSIRPNPVVRVPQYRRTVLPPPINPPSPDTIVITPPSPRPTPFTPVPAPVFDPEPVKEIQTTIDASSSSYPQLLSRASTIGLGRIAQEFANPNRQEVSIFILATRQGGTAPIFSARVSRQVWQNDPTGASWANHITRSQTLLGYGVASRSSRTVPIQLAPFTNSAEIRTIPNQ